MNHANDAPKDPAATLTLTTHNGQAVLVRHLQATDAQLLEDMFYKLSPQSRWRRFFVPLENVDPEVVRNEALRLATLDPTREVALIALADDEAIAVARYAGIDANDASVESSIVVREDYQGQGLGLQLMDLLIQIALVQNVRHMVMLTHADNHGMIAIVRHLGLPYKGQFSGGLYEIDLQLGPNDKSIFPFSGGAASDS